MKNTMNNADEHTPGHIVAPGDRFDELQDQSGDQAGEQFVSFWIGNSTFAVQIMCVREIRAWAGFTKLPNTPPHIIGMINLRGDIIPVVDVALRFGNPPTDVNSSKVVIVVSVNGKLSGLLVDGVSDILSINEQAIRDVPQLEGTSQQRFLKSLITIEEEMIAIVNVDELVG